MKTLLILSFAFFICAPLFTYGSLEGTNTMRKETVKIKCDKMHCEGCKATIMEALQSMDGVSKINVDLKTKIIKVTFDNSKTDKAKISEKILEVGYENEIIS
jgi:copper chaperone